MSRRTALLLLIAANVLFCGVLSFYRTTDAAGPPPARAPFANSVEQRIEMINQLKEINALLKEQNTLLRSGELTVLVGDPAKKKKAVPDPKRR